MDRVDDLRMACQRAHQLGEILLEALRDAPGEGAFERINQLVTDRENATTVAAQLFQPGDEVALSLELQALTQQQQVLESEMKRLVETLRQAYQEVEAARTTARSARRLMGTTRRGRLVNKIL